MQLYKVKYNFKKMYYFHKSSLYYNDSNPKLQLAEVKKKQNNN